ncbi:MAG: carboxyl transferase domain-containing protein [Myxococcota bacterium]|nr:carboxyl transferase domain-containing protein [Myxococcota bacterium]
MSWKDEVDEIRRRRELAREQGGPEAIARQHERGRLTVRERIDALVDKDSFREVGGIAGQPELDGEGRAVGFTPTNVVVGTARVDGRPVVVGGDDFTVRGGAYTEGAVKKGLHADQLALERRVPLIRLLEGGGASIKGVSGTRGRSGYDFTSASPLNVLSMETLASVPVVCAALGAVAGFPAARLVASHLSIMTKETAQVLTGGPRLVERAMGVAKTKEELGGAQVHLRSGVVGNLAEDEADVWRQARAFLGYLPTNVWESPPVVACDDPPERGEEALLSIVPRNRRRAYKVRKLIELVVDRHSLFELTPLYGRSQVTGLARVNGRSVGVLANDCYQDGGAMTAEGAQKIRRFAELCDAFHLPILSFVDEPGFMIGPEAESRATIRYGMEAMFAVQQTEVPWLAVLVRKAFGVAAGIHLGPGATVLAWPSAESGAMPVESGVALAYRQEIDAADDPETRRRELEDEIAAAQSVFPRAEDFGVHDLIDPRETRGRICQWVEDVEPRVRLLRGPRRYTMRP